MIIRWKGKKWRWEPEKMHGALLVGGSGIFALVAAGGLWAVLTVLMTIGG